MFLWASLGSLTYFIFILSESGYGYLFSSFSSGSCTNLLLGENGFPLFSVFPSLPCYCYCPCTVCNQYCIVCNINNGDI
jgi:hypothetical protein